MVIAPLAAGRSRALEEAVARLVRRHGEAVLRRGADAMAAPPWSTGIPALDALTGVGGLPRGRLCVIAGARGAGAGATGRLTLLQALAAGASRSMDVAYLDLAGTLDPGFLADLGADLESCLILRPPGGAAGPGLAMARALVRAGVPWLGIALGGGTMPSGGAGRPGRAAFEHALNALVGVCEGMGTVACVSAPAPLPAALAHASTLTLGCASAGWQEVHGDVAGLRVRLGVEKARLGRAAGAPAAVRLLLRYPRPWAPAEVLGLPAVVAPGEAAVAGHDATTESDRASVAARASAAVRASAAAR